MNLSETIISLEDSINNNFFIYFDFSKYKSAAK